MPVITLSTDFGLTDGYVAAMKGVLLSRLPQAQVVDLNHSTPPQDILSGAFVFEQSWRYYPPATTHLVVIDPGVGSSRRRLAIAANGQFFVGPDNSCLSAALPDATRGLRALGEPYVARPIELNPDVVAVSIENAAIMQQPVSAIFEGRDVFAPAAAFIAGGGQIDELGPRLSSIASLPAFRAPRRGGQIAGSVVHSDHFGNLISDIRVVDLAPGQRFLAGGHELRLVKTYADATGLCAIAGSTGFIEIALPGGSAAQTLGMGPGDRVLAE